MLTVGHTLHLEWLGLSLGSWSLLYLLLRAQGGGRKPEWHCRLVTVVHASLISVMSGWAVLVEGPWPFTDAGGPNTALQVVVVTICLGYFLFDFSWCLYFQTEGFSMLLHHSLSIFGMVFLLVAGRNGTEMMATIFGSELTNPLLQLRWFLKETGRYRTWAGEAVDVLFMTSFFTLRILVGSYLLYCYFLQTRPDSWGRLGAVCIYLIGWMFWVSIFQYAVYKYGKMYRAWRSGGGGKQRQSAGGKSLPDTATSGKSLSVGKEKRKGKSWVLSSSVAEVENYGSDQQQLIDNEGLCHADDGDGDDSSWTLERNGVVDPSDAADEQISSSSWKRETTGKKSGSQNGVVHRTNGTHSPTKVKGQAEVNGTTVDTDAELR